MTRGQIESMLDAILWRRIELPPPNERTDGLPVATHQGVLDLAGRKLRVYQLSDGRRVIDSRDLEAFFSEALAPSRKRTTR